MIKEQSSNSYQNWFLFDDRNIISDFKDRNAQKLIASRLNRPMDYCNWPLAKFHEDENALGKNWKLKHLFVFFRHGQRASAKPMTETDYQYYINCSLRQFLSFKIHDWKEFINSLDKSNIPSADFDMKGICKESQLTLLGILQMFIVGSRLNKAYQSFLKLNPPTISSTPYQRTMLSSEIIQYQLMKNVGDHSSKIQESQSLVFCRPDSNITCQCPSLRFFYSKYNRYKSHQIEQNVKCLSVISKFNSIFSFTTPLSDNLISSLSNLFDIVSTALCASSLDEIGKSNVFCWPSKKAIINQEPWSFYKNVDGDVDESGTILKDKKITNARTGPCIPLKLIIDLWNCVDEVTEKVNTYQYFRKYSKLAVFPILSEIVSSVMMKTPQESSIKNSKQLETKVGNHFIYVGHDHTLRYLLSAFDFKNSMDRSIYNFINLWPGFASRLVIEVFEKTSQERLKFRLLYNGIIITSSLKFCPSNQDECDFQLLSNYLYSKEFWDYELFSSAQYSQECIGV